MMLLHFARLRSIFTACRACTLPPPASVACLKQAVPDMKSSWPAPCQTFSCTHTFSAPARRASRQYRGKPWRGSSTPVLRALPCCCCRKAHANSLHCRLQHPQRLILNMLPTHIPYSTAFLMALRRQQPLRRRRRGYTPPFPRYTHTRSCARYGCACAPRLYAACAARFKPHTLSRTTAISIWNNQFGDSSFGKKKRQANLLAPTNICLQHFSHYLYRHTLLTINRHLFPSPASPASASMKGTLTAAACLYMTRVWAARLTPAARCRVPAYGALCININGRVIGMTYLPNNRLSASPNMFKRKCLVNSSHLTPLQVPMVLRRDLLTTEQRAIKRVARGVTSIQAWRNM